MAPALATGSRCGRSTCPATARTDLDPDRRLQAQARGGRAAPCSPADRPAHLIGHSFGGTVALRLAVEAPERVAPPHADRAGASSPCSPRPIAAAYAAEMAAGRCGARRSPPGDWPAAAAAFLGALGAGRPAAGPARRPMVARMPLVGAAGDRPLRRRGRGAAAPTSPRIACPVLLINGARVTAGRSRAILDVHRQHCAARPARRRSPAPATWSRSPTRAAVVRRDPRLPRARQR